MATNQNEQQTGSSAADEKPDEAGAEAKAPLAEQKQKGAHAGVNPVRRWTFIVLAICAVLLIYHLIADFLTPYTSQAYVQTFVVDIAPEVAGAVVEVDVADNAEVVAGQKLFRIDPLRFRIAVEAAEAKLAQAGQSIGASTSGIASSEARSSAAQSNLENIRKQSARARELVEKGIYSRAKGDEMQAALETAEADVKRARADVESARKQLGSRGADNPQIRTATAELERARLDLEKTTVLAPADGLITNLKLSVGKYAPAGTPVMTFLDTRTGWVVAELREKSLGNLQKGDKAEVVLDGHPGEVFPAHVESIAWGVSAGPGRDSSGLPTVGEQKEWLLGPCRLACPGRRLFRRRQSHEWPGLAAYPPGELAQLCLLKPSRTPAQISARGNASTRQPGMRCALRPASQCRSWLAKPWGGTCLLSLRFSRC
jgi:multidrug resistance efflux pump